MGQSSSHRNGQNKTSSNGTVGTSRRSSFRSPFIKRKKHRKQLSATFTYPNTDNYDKLNINTATIEQLMTLPHINRTIAERIVEHRARIGGRFQRIDDLALVSGIGAVKLDLIRPEICVKKATNPSVMESDCSSRTPSLDSVLSRPSCRDGKQILNVNTATVFQLQQLDGLNQELAAKIVDYRNCKGPFKRLEQLLRIKGISSIRFSTIRQYLTLSDEDVQLTPSPVRQINSSTFYTSLSDSGNVLKRQISSPEAKPHNEKDLSPCNDSAKSHRKSMSVPLKMNLMNGYMNVPINDIFELLGAYSHRPIVPTSVTRDTGRTLRIASWNLDRFSTSKSMNLGVKEVVCRTILENKLSIIGLQEIIEPEAVQNICDELNNPTLPRIIEWNDNPKTWKYVLNSTCANKRFYHLNGLAFIYNELECEYNANESMDLLFHQFPIDTESIMEKEIIMPSGILGAFKIGNWTLRILNIYLRYCNMLQIDKLIESIMDDLAAKVASTNSPIQIEDIFAVVGDFSAVSYAEEKLKELTKFNKFEIDNEADVYDEDWDNQTLQRFGYFSAIKPRSTNAQQSEIANETSSCNILCRERLPLLNGTSYLRNGAKIPCTHDKLLTGRAGTIRDGISHMAIPNNWTWGGFASQHCPIWVEMRKPFEPSALTNGSIDSKLSEMLSKVSNLNGNIISNGDKLKYPNGFTQEAA